MKNFVCCCYVFLSDVSFCGKSDHVLWNIAIFDMTQIEDSWTREKVDSEGLFTISKSERESEKETFQREVW